LTHIGLFSIPETRPKTSLPRPSKFEKVSELPQTVASWL